MRTALRKMGNSTGVIVPKAVLAELEVRAGDALELQVDEGKIVLAPIGKKVRERWEEAAKAVGESDDTSFLDFADDIGSRTLVDAATIELCAKVVDDDRRALLGK